MVKDKKIEAVGVASELHHSSTRLLAFIKDGLARLAAFLKGEHAKKAAPILAEIENALNELSNQIKRIEIKGEKTTTKEKSGPKHFDILNLLQQTCLSHDVLFLRRQVSYHISASSSLPRVYADVEQISTALQNLLASCINYVPRKGEIDILTKEVTTRYGTAMEVKFLAKGRQISEKERTKIFGGLFGFDEINSEEAEFDITLCKKIIQDSYGQFWIEFPSDEVAEFSFNLPCEDISHMIENKGRHTYKYDILIQNYIDLKNKYGENKSVGLLTQVEDYVRTLIRHPIDIVVAFANSGTVSAIYETPEGAAQSVAGRISQKLRAEEFRIGKSSIDLSFKYKLSAIK